MQLFKYQQKTGITPDLPPAHQRITGRSLSGEYSKNRYLNFFSSDYWPMLLTRALGPNNDNLTTTPQLIHTSCPRTAISTVVWMTWKRSTFSQLWANPVAIVLKISQNLAQFTNWCEDGHRQLFEWVVYFVWVNEWKEMTWNYMNDVYNELLDPSVRGEKQERSSLDWCAIKTGMKPYLKIVMIGFSIAISFLNQGQSITHE